MELPAPNSLCYTSLLNDAQQQHSEIQVDSSSRHDDCDTYGNDYDVRSREPQSQWNVDFTANNFDELDNSFDGFGCYPHIPQQNFTENQNDSSNQIREFGSDVTNRKKLQHPPVARRGRPFLRNNRRRPY